MVMGPVARRYLWTAGAPDCTTAHTWSALGACFDALMHLPYPFELVSQYLRRSGTGKLEHTYLSMRCVFIPFAQLGLRDEERKREKYYPLLARKANLGSAH